MRIHDIERHLDRIKFEAAFARHFEHVKMNARIFVSCKPDVPQLSGLFRLKEG